MLYFFNIQYLGVQSQINKSMRRTSGVLWLTDLQKFVHVMSYHFLLSSISRFQLIIFIAK